jgi:phosphate transport system substrate-binding protein
MFKIRFLITIFLLGLLTISCSAQSPGSNAPINADEANAHIEVKGSDTMVNLALAWAEAYQKEAPNISISITGGGSGTGIAALLNNTVDIANASRRIKEEEITHARSLGIDPYEIIIARDAVAVIVNPTNPIDHLTLQQVSDIYQGKYENWQELGGEDRPIVRVSRETNSGTHVYFLETVLRLGDPENKALFHPNTLLLPSSEGIIAEVRDNPNAIGYDGLGYVTPEVKVLGIESSPEKPTVFPSIESVSQGTYPIARDLYVYTNGEPDGAIKDYLDWILSAPGQNIVTELGFVSNTP